MIDNFLRAAIDNVVLSENNEILIQGWVVHSRERIISISIYEGDVLLVSEFNNLTPRPDVQAIHSNFPHPLLSGFIFNGLRLIDKPPVSYFPFCITAFLSDGKTQTINIPFLNDQEERARLPVPPSSLMIRVRGYESNWLVVGAIIHQCLKSHIENHRLFSDCKRILDWGCGSANVLRYLTYEIPSHQIYGCDIDSEAINWNKQNIPGPTFLVNDYLPPLPFEDNYFDLIYGISIFTHLNEELQFKWLEELARVSAPGAIIAVSIHGESLATELDSSLLTPDVRKAIDKGIVDFDSSQQVDFAPFSTENYYRETYHTKAYVMKKWSKYFKIVDYVERGIHSFQDLVIMVAA